MEPKSIIEFAEKYFTKMCSTGTQWSFSAMFYRNHIPNEKLVNARKTYADLSSDEESVLLLLDDTVFGSAKKGFVMTESNIYYSMDDTYGGKTVKGVLSLDSLEAIAFEKRKMSVDIIINGERFANITQLGDNERQILGEFFRKLFTNDLEITKESIRESVESKIDPKILQRIREYMIDEEEILYVAWGVDSITARDFIVCTTNRIIIIDREFFGLGENIRDFEYDVITSIGVQKEGTGILDSLLKQCKLEVHAAGSVFSIDTLQRSEAEQVIRILAY